MQNILGKITKFLLLPIVISGAFFAWSLPRITTDYNFNSDELIYLSRSNYWTAFKTGDFKNHIWSEWGAYDQPQLTNYIYAAVPGDRSLLEPQNSPCPITTPNHSFYNTWQCLDGPPINTWSTDQASLRNMVISARTLATGISSLAVMTTYYLGLVVSGPLTGILAALYLGYFSFFKDLSTMAMMDQILLVFLNLQFIATLIAIRTKRSTLFPLLMLGATTGLAFSTKLSAAIPSMIIYLFLGLTSLSKKKLTFVNLSISALLAVGIFITLHPPLWSSPITEFIHMFTWRAAQIAGQTSVTTLPTGIVDKFVYSFSEIFVSWPLALTTLLGIIGMSYLNPSFTILGLTNILLFILILPLKWNRYLLPIMPAIAVLTGSLPMTIISVAKYLVTRFNNNFAYIKQFGLGAMFALVPVFFILLFPISSWLSVVILLLTTILTIQGFLMTMAMLYGFSHKEKRILEPHAPLESFTLIVPARDESEVIAHTINSLDKLNYPNSLYEVLIMIRADDYKTIKVAETSINKLNSKNIRVIQIDGEAHNKAYSLNIGLKMARYNTIGIFDAEDDPHADILLKVNNFMADHQNISAVQAPVHLTNINSSWYASLNAIEYYYWFASVLPYLATKKIVPLGGNTIFIKKDVYRKVGTYDEVCLTEDADFGIRLAANHIQVGVIDDATLATKEGAPSSEIDVIRQRSRWDQGYFQVLEKNNWQTLSNKQKFYALYTLTQPLFRHLSFLNMIFAPLLATIGKIPLMIVLLSFIPGYFLVLQLGLYLIGLSDLARLHNLKISPWRYIGTLLAFVPYQALLALATLRALFRLSMGNLSWDKTIHTNNHRSSLAILES